MSGLFDFGDNGAYVWAGWLISAAVIAVMAIWVGLERARSRNMEQDASQ